MTVERDRDMLRNIQFPKMKVQVGTAQSIKRHDESRVNKVKATFFCLFVSTRVESGNFVTIHKI